MKSSRDVVMDKSTFGASSTTFQLSASYSGISGNFSSCDRPEYPLLTIPEHVP